MVFPQRSDIERSKVRKVLDPAEPDQSCGSRKTHQVASHSRVVLQSFDDLGAHNDPE